MGANRWRSVTVSVGVGFGLCLIAVAVLIATATQTSFRNERDDAEATLLAVAEAASAGIGNVAFGAQDFMEGLADNPNLASFTEEGCRATLNPLRNLTEGAPFRATLVDPAGGLVCSTADGPVSATLPGQLAASGLQGAIDPTQVFVDDVSRLPSVATSVAVEGLFGRGALVAVLPVETEELDLPPAVDERTTIVALDAERSMVIAASDGAPYEVGASVDDSSLRQPLDDAARTIVDPDGVERIWHEHVDEATGWPVLAGLDVDVAFAGAHDQRRSLLLLGAGVGVLVVVLAFTLQRRLARPIKRLGVAIASSQAGDREARAPLAGPSELVSVASAFNDLVETQYALEGRLRHSARHDPLTGLLNRRAAAEELDRLLTDPAASPLAVLFVDLDRFKLINDSHGHTVGDKLLIALADRLRAAVPARWIVTRFGGDEFVIICPSTPDPVPHVEGIGAMLRSSFRIGEHDLTVGGSIGIAMARPGEAADDLIREADTAMYRAKESGGGGHALFDDEMRAWTIARLTTERDLRLALDRDELRLHFQPVVDLTSGTVVAAEALVRWQHPERGLLAPAAFIPVAEETGLIVGVGDWVLAAACRQAVAWREAGTPVPVAVNVAASQLVHGDLPATVAAALTRTGARPSDLSLEVTESALLTDLDVAVAQLDAVRRLGVGVSLDDFGTGYSSLAYLQQLPADELKIDRSFVATVGEDAVSTAIVSSVIDLAHAVGLTVVAEGVERADQVRLLTNLGCDRAQGFHLARPRPAAELSLVGGLAAQTPAETTA